MTAVTSNLTQLSYPARRDYPAASRSQSSGSSAGLDKKPLAQALDEIDAALSTEPADLGETVDALLTSQVKAGMLTQDEAGVLRQALSDAPDEDGEQTDNSDDFVDFEDPADPALASGTRNRIVDFLREVQQAMSPPSYGMQGQRSAFESSRSLLLDCRC